jgi:hypothetical protein
MLFETHLLSGVFIRIPAQVLLVHPGQKPMALADFNAPYRC